MASLLVALTFAGGYAVAAEKTVTLTVDGSSVRVSTMKSHVIDVVRDYLGQHFAGFGTREVNLDDLERLLGREGDGGAGLHLVRSPMKVAAAYACKKRLIQPATRALSLGASSEAIATSGSGTMS